MSDSVHLQRASVLSGQGRHDMAEKELRAHVALEPEDAVGHALLAITLSELERWDEAEAAGRASIGYDPELPLAHYALANVLLDRNRTDEAVGAIREAIRLDPGRPDFYSTLSAAELARRDWQAALDAAEKGLAFDAEHVGCNNLRAMALVRLGRKSEAGITMDTTLARDPHDSVSHANMGWTKLEQGQRKEAMVHFQEALRLDPTNDWARSGLVEAIKAGNPVYALMLKYFLYMGKLTRRQMWFIILGGYVGYRVLRSVSQQYPELAPWLLPLIVAYIAFVLLSWLAGPLFDLALFVHPMGKHALTEDDRARAKLVGAALGVAVVAGLSSLLLPAELDLGLLAIVSGLLSIPASAIHVCSPGWPRRVMGALSGALAVLGGTGWLVLGMVRPPEESGMETLGLAALGFFFLGIFASQFVANWLAGKTPTR